MAPRLAHASTPGGLIDPRKQAQKDAKSLYIPDRLFAFGCVPLRTAVFACATVGAILGWLQLGARAYVHHHFLIFIGGYTLQSRLALDAVNILGAFSSLAGMAGAFNLSSQQLSVYFGYLAVRLLASLWMYFNDVPMLLHCTSDTAVVPLAPGHCQQERLFFFPCSAIALLSIIYVSVCVQRLIADLDSATPLIVSSANQKPIGAPRSLPAYLQHAGPALYGAASMPMGKPPMPPMPVIPQSLQPPLACVGGVMGPPQLAMPPLTPLTQPGPSGFFGPQPPSGFVLV